MPTSLLNSKKCLKASGALLGLTCWSLSVAWGAPPPHSRTLEAQLVQDLHAYQGKRQFDGLIEQWRRAHGQSAVRPLLQLAQQTRLDETERYMALLGAAKIGGASVATDALPFLKSPSWMLRSGALRILSAFRATQSPELFFARLKDSALVIRTQAAVAVANLKPKGWEQALSNAVLDPLNYAGGKAQLVPQKALEALIKSGDAFTRTRLRASMSKVPDPMIRAKIRNWDWTNSLRVPRQ